MAIFAPSAQGLSHAQYTKKLRDAVQLFGPKSSQVGSLKASWMGRPFVPGQPFTANSLPPGTYDVALDQQLAASRRGLGYTEADLARAGTRESDDFQRGLAQLMQDRGHDTAALDLSYGRLGATQYQAARAAGVARGGALAQALQKRTENQGREQADITTNYDRRQGALTQAFERGVQDRSTQLQRSQSEAGFFEGDIGGLKIQQAKQSGFEIPAQPAGYRTIKGNLGTTWYVLPNGQVTRKKPK